MTLVYDLNRDRTITYDPLPAHQAVICAFAQFGRGDWNTWDYDKYLPLVRFGEDFVSCGDFSAPIDDVGRGIREARQEAQWATI